MNYQINFLVEILREHVTKFYTRNPSRMTQTDESKNPAVGATKNIKYAKSSMSDKRKLTKKLMEAGKEIFTQQNFRDVKGPETTPIMLPPCPITQFIDKFPSKNHTKAEATAAKQQAQYEGEVKVFYALERLDQPLFIMHSFKYTHQQYALFVDHQCKRKDIEEEGEADFVAVQDDLIAIYEVKAVEFADQNVRTVFERNYKKSREQLEKTSILIKNICRQTGSFKPEILKYTVFTNLDRKTAEKISKYSSLDTFQKSEILLKEDLEINEGIIRIGNCFKREINDIKTLNSRHLCRIKSQVLWTLLGIWCADEKNEFSRDKWDLGRIINQVDNLLRNANISNKPEGPKSSKIKGSPAELKKLGILCLTEEQKQILYSKNHRIVINGPAGSGKTVLILGKIIQLARKSQGLIVLMVSTKLIGDWYAENLRKSGISSVCSLNSDEKHEVVIEVIEDYSTNKSGFVSLWAFARMIAITQVFELDAHVFIDDFHAFDFVFKYYPIGLEAVRNDKIKDLWQYTLSQLRVSSEKTFWVCYDTLQSTFHTSFDKQLGDIEHWQSNNTVLKLSSNLRNSYEIANFLQFARDERLFNIRKCILLINNLADRNMPYKPFDVKQDIGHFIHGPSPRFHWVDLHGREDKKSEYLINFLVNKVTDILSCKRVAIIHDDYGDPIKHFKKVCVTEEPSDELKQSIEKLAAIDPIKLDEICQKAKETVFSEFKDCEMDLQVFHMDEVISAEWPAVIGIVKVQEKCNIALDLDHNDVMKDFYKDFMSQPLFRYEYKVKQDPIDRLLAKINAIVSRGRAYCALICVIDEDEPLLNTKDVQFIHHFSQEYINATAFRSYGNNIIDKILLGELEARSKLPVCDPINLTREQLQDLINNISLIEKAIRLPSGKIIQPCVLASKVAESYGLEVPANLDENRQWRPLNFNDEQLAIQFRNEKNIFMKSSIQRLIHFPKIKLLSVAKWSYYTEPEIESHRLLDVLEQSEIIRLPNNLSAEDRCKLVEGFLLFYRYTSDAEGQKFIGALTESHYKKEDSSWKLFRSLSPAKKYMTWVTVFAAKRLLKFRTVE